MEVRWIDLNFQSIDGAGCAHASQQKVAQFVHIGKARLRQGLGAHQNGVAQL